MRKAVRDIFVIAAMKSVPDIKRQPFILALLGLVSAIPIFMLMASGGSIEFGIIGGIVGSISFWAINQIMQDTAWDRYMKMREMIVAMPVQPLSYALGQALATLIISLPSLLLFLGLAVWMGFVPVTALGYIALLIVLFWGTVSCVSFTIATYLQKANQYTINTMANILGIGLTFLPPVYYAEEHLGVFSWVAEVIPTSNAVGLIRYYSGLLPLSTETVLLRWALLAATFVISAVLLIRKSRWREA